MTEQIEETKRGWIAARVKCDLCTCEWIAVFHESVEKIECPHCHHIVDFEIIEL